MTVKDNRQRSDGTTHDRRRVTPEGRTLPAPTERPSGGPGDTDVHQARLVRLVSTVDSPEVFRTKKKARTPYPQPVPPSPTEGEKWIERRKLALIKGDLPLLGYNRNRRPPLNYVLHGKPVAEDVDGR